MGYTASRNDNKMSSGSEEASDSSEVPKRPSGLDRMKQGAAKAKGAYDSYKDAGSLGNLAKNKAKEAIGNKLNDKKDELKDKAKDKLNDAMPDSVKKAKDAAKNKLDAVKDKVNKPKEKLEEAKEKLNEKVFRTGVKAAVNAAAPGAGEAAEKMLDTPIGEPALDKAKAAANPVQGLVEGSKELVKIIEKKVAIKTAISMVAPYVGILLFAVIILASVAKFGDSQTFFHGSADDDDKGISAIENDFDEKYASFYKNIDKYAGKYDVDSAMIVAVLTAYQDNDIYTNIDDPSEADDLDPDLDVEGDGAANPIEKESKSYMKKQIKKVAKKMKDSGSIVEGDYVNRSSGSDFFWWLLDDYVEDYYSDAFGDEMDSKTREATKREIVEFIYMYYEDLHSDQEVPTSYYTSICPSGVTITNGQYAGNYQVEDYIKGVVAQEAGAWTNFPEALKAHAVAARSFLAYTTEKKGNCEVKNSTSFMVYRDPTGFNAVIKAVDETAGIVVRKKGKIHNCTWVTIPVTKYITESGDNYVFDLLYDANDPSSSHKYTMPKRVFSEKVYSEGGLVRPAESSDHHWGMIQYGAVYEEREKGRNYEEILKIFYGNDIEFGSTAMSIPGGGIVLGNKGVYSASIFPIATEMKNLVVTQGYRYGGGDFHGAVDIFCNRNMAKKQNVAGWREWCNSIPIIAAHAGTIQSVTSDYCANPIYKGKSLNNMDTTLKRVNGCGGMGIVVKVTDSNDPFYGYSFTYWHFEKFADGIKKGAQIQPGQILGYMGSTGSSTGWHLHFKITNKSNSPLNQNDNIRAFCAANKLTCNTLNGDGEGIKY